jgi:hypothetical protein
MSYGADAQLNPSHPFYYYFANPAGSNLDPRSPGAATGAGAGEGVTPMMMMVPSPGTDGAAAGPVLMPFAFPPGGSLPAGMDPQQLFQEVVAPPIRKPSKLTTRKSLERIKFNLITFGIEKKNGRTFHAFEYEQYNVNDTVHLMDIYLLALDRVPLTEV